MTHIRVTFQEVRQTRTKRGKCVVCGKPCVRKKKVTQTLNPFNRNLAGIPKTEDEIIAELQAKLEAWAKLPITHEGCEDT